MGPPTSLTLAAKFLVPVFAQLCTGREQIWQAWWGQTLAHATHLAEAVIYVLKPFLLLSLVTGGPDSYLGAGHPNERSHPQFPWMLRYDLINEI